MNKEMRKKLENLLECYPVLKEDVMPIVAAIFDDGYQQGYDDGYEERSAESIF